ncbi:pimeloyl-ACP methyl ester carboxylesterase [Micromonospora pisi]|uniref:Pimeloyl-ACP methyl ester carboxylesterase n=1 Tax=Micromonospora pisi TaxID=589240 RepID=A0A495JH07_9ACTN|nr:alpha/beta hydrolase [Micromonospora pisi]RKR88061.1 pimeloyl-ACP methyl ester carboxylesterase [Micromonospora pisi]
MSGGHDGADRAVPYLRRTVPVDGGELTVGEWGHNSGPVLLAVHGITSSHLAWSVVGERLGVDHRLVAVDLRGRGGSRDLPGPYGMARHAADLVRVIEAYGGGPVVVLGHSMGGFVAIELAHRHPELVRRLVLVDGGALLPAPPGLDSTADEQAISAAIAATVGPAFTRLSMTFPDRESYRQMWREHPAFADWTPAMLRYVDYDLVGVAPELQPSCRLPAAVRDARDQYAYPGVEPTPLPVPAVFLRAPRGLLDEPDKPLYPDGYATHWLPGVREETVPGVNHYTIALGDTGAAAIESAVRVAG